MQKQFLFLWKLPRNCVWKTVFSYKIGKKSSSRKSAQFLEERDFLAHELMYFTFSLPTLAIKRQMVRDEVWVRA